MKNLKILFAFGLLAAIGFGQATLTSTTLSAALSDASTAGQSITFQVASATGFSAPNFNTPNNPFASNQTVAYVDHELIFVTGVNGTVITGLRGWNGTPVSGHISGATVYVGPPAYFSQNDKFGSCTSTNLDVLPVFNVLNGAGYRCATTGGQWFQALDGTMIDHQRTTFTSFCSGTVGSAETETLNNTTCSGGTTKSLIFTVPYSGVLYGFRASSTANFLGTGGSTFTVLKNGSATSIVAAPTAATKVASDTTHSVTVAAGDLINITFLSSTSDTAANINVSLNLY